MGLVASWLPIPSKPFTNDYQLKYFIMVGRWKMFDTFLLNMVILQIYTN
jgi:hypothetical protein